MGYNETPYGRNIMDRIKQIVNHPTTKLVVTIAIITATVNAVDYVGKKIASSNA